MRRDMAANTNLRLVGGTSLGSVRCGGAEDCIIYAFFPRELCCHSCTRRGWWPGVGARGQLIWEGRLNGQTAALNVGVVDCLRGAAGGWRGRGQPL